MSNDQRSSSFLAVRFALAAIMVGVFFGLSTVGTAQRLLVADRESKSADAKSEVAGRVDSPEGTIPMAPGDLIVYRAGDGVTALSSAAAPVFLDEYTTAPSQILPVRSYPMPTVVNGANKRFTTAGSSTSEGFLTRSVDAKYLLAPGYDADPGTLALAGTTSAAVNRVVARITSSGAADTTTALNDAYSTSNIRGIASTNGTDIWTTGTGTPTSSAGTRYTTFGSTTSTQLSSTPTNTRTVNIFGGQLYITAASGAFFGVSTVGTGLPTTSGQTTTVLPGFPTATGPSPYAFFFYNATTIYVADDRAVASGGGVQKWTFAAGTWTLAATFSNGLTGGCRGLVAKNNGGLPTIYATTSNNQLVAVTDDGTANPLFAVLATGPANTAMRGIAFAPITATAADVSVSGRVMTADGRGITNVRVAVTGNSLPEPIVAITGRFGTYSIPGLESGQTYVITVGARRFTFTQPSRVLSLVDNVSDADFVAEQ